MKVVIAGGGTGGHLFPGLAIAEEFQRRSSDTDITFVGTKEGIESRVLPKEGYPLLLITSSGIKGKSLPDRAKSLALIPYGLLQSLLILIKCKPDIVVGVGGYVSGPLILSAVFLGLPTLIHEQNFYPGITNRILSRLVGRIAITFADSLNYFPKEKVVITGNPVRRKFLEVSASNDLPIIEAKFTIFIFGGSQGSHRINMTVLETLPLLQDFKKELFIIHQTGFNDLEIVEEGYTKNGFMGLIKPFIYNMAECYRRANLIICRAGASTIAEITALGKAAILIPYPYAANNHQVLNAESLSQSGAAISFKEGDLTPEALAAEIIKLRSDGDKLCQIEKKSQALARPQAAKEIVDLCLAEVRKRK